MKIVITGATGFIGSHVAVRMAMAEHRRAVPVELEDRGYGPPLRYDLAAIKRDFGLAFQGRDQLRAHVRWLLANRWRGQAGASGPRCDAQGATGRPETRAQGAR